MRDRPHPARPRDGVLVEALQADRQAGLRGVGLPTEARSLSVNDSTTRSPGSCPEIHGRLALVEGHGIDAHEMHRGGP
ncbi:hypothetical protein CTI14_53495 [Methylobacterium radiotolerans]|nr:hypothetical protein CTI14_53495 [Methylobacterium radiotolerans]